MMGGRHVFDVPAGAAKFGISDMKSKCWPVLLTSKKPPHSLQLCPAPSEPSHGDHTGLLAHPPARVGHGSCDRR
eukprot:5650731-Pleurochrysis_carterae.AAC.1